MTLKPADALLRHWTDRLPAVLKPFAQLSRWDRPIGWQLLLMPCWMGLALSATQEGFYFFHLQYAFAFLVGAIAMRGAGCTYNDLLDRDIDAKVERTRSRPLPSGRVSPGAALAWLIAQCAVGFLVLLSLPPYAEGVALCSIPLVALYPLMKRVTWWPQAWLGIVFSWGALVAGGAASTPPELSPAIITLYAGCIAWTIGYDTIYALQDREDDALIGVRSTARLFGEHWRRWTGGFYFAAIILWSLAGGLAGAPIWFGVALGVIGAVFVWPLLANIDDSNPDTALKAFKQNALIGLLVVGAMALAPLWVSILPYVGGALAE